MVSTQAYILQNKSHKYQWYMSVEYRKTYMWVLMSIEGMRKVLSNDHFIFFGRSFTQRGGVYILSLCHAHPFR